jgi:hypothetical protein
VRFVGSGRHCEEYDRGGVTFPEFIELVNKKRD